MFLPVVRQRTCGPEREPSRRGRQLDPLSDSAPVGIGQNVGPGLHSLHADPPQYFYKPVTTRLREEFWLKRNDRVDENDDRLSNGAPARWFDVSCKNFNEFVNLETSARPSSPRCGVVAHKRSVAPADSRSEPSNTRTKKGRARGSESA